MNCSSQRNQLYCYDIIVCGGGHAGCEAALSASRMDAKVLLITGNIDLVAQMNCNPAIGGQGKGQIVCEIDALGGEMAVNADVTSIQYRLLNSSKGLAVQSLRAQCDKKAYQYRMKHTLELQNRLRLFQATVINLICQNGRVSGISTSVGINFYSKVVIITTGTFLRPIVHVGDRKDSGIQMIRQGSVSLSNNLQNLGIRMDRFKTGTPPRILGSGIDFKECKEQLGDRDVGSFSFCDTRQSKLFDTYNKDQKKIGWVPGTNQTSCWITHTNKKTSEIIKESLKHSALYRGIVGGIGPRYCPSLEDKYVKFFNQDKHIVFLEPEGRHTDEWYVNGLSNNFPFDVQSKIINSIAGLEKAKISRPAYSIEYDFALPNQLLSTLESKTIEGLFLAGQINGSSGYEEAAAQGLIAGINSIAKLRNMPALIIGRQHGYIGVLIDDLVTKETKEPYRIFTSRAEFRLLFNSGSAELRMFPLIKNYGLIDWKRLKRIKEKINFVNFWTERLETMKDKQFYPYGDLIRSGSCFDKLSMPEQFNSLSMEVRNEVFYRIHYRGYVDRELRIIRKINLYENMHIPYNINYNSIFGLRLESIQKLELIKPISIGQASRINGVNPTDINILTMEVKKISKYS